MRKFRALVSPIVLGLLISLLTPSPAYANTTTQTCDTVPKYYCAYVSYVDEGSYVDWLSRWWRGGLGGSSCPTYCTTKDWKIWWVQDWTWNGSTWVWQRNFGQSLWYQDCCLQTWRSSEGYAIDKPALVNFMFCYRDWHGDTQTYSYWTSPQLNHYLDGSAPTIVGGGGTCS